MLNMRMLREDFTEIQKKLAHRGEDLSDLEKFGEYDKKRRQLIAKTEQLKAKRNEASKQISVLKREKKDASDVIQEMRDVSEQIKNHDAELATIEEKLEQMMLSIPNIPHKSVPIGDNEDDNVVNRTWGDIPQFSFEAKTHWDLAGDLNILDFERAAKVAGSRFVFYQGLGARLERALRSEEGRVGKEW